MTGIATKPTKTLVISGVLRDALLNSQYCKRASERSSPRCWSICWRVALSAQRGDESAGWPLHADLSFPLIFSLLLLSPHLSSTLHLLFPLSITGNRPLLPRIHFQAKSWPVARPVSCPWPRRADWYGSKSSSVTRGKDKVPGFGRNLIHCFSKTSYCAEKGKMIKGYVLSQGRTLDRNNEHSATAHADAITKFT